MDLVEPATANWLVGDRLANVLHVGDRPLAHQLADRGHDVVVASTEIVALRHQDASYVRCADQRLPFAAQSFDAVVLPDRSVPPTVLAGYARVLRSDGVVATTSRHDDETLPWLRRLREIIGQGRTPEPSWRQWHESGLFHPVEVKRQGTWIDLDLSQFLRFANEQAGPDVTSANLAQARELFDNDARATGFLRLRREVTAARARIDAAALSFDEPPTATALISFS